MTILEAVKIALRITTDAYDGELDLYIKAAQADMAVAGVTYEYDDSDPNELYQAAIITYVRARFGSPSDYDRLKACYDEQKAQLSMATGYTTWSDEA